jgi:hypothetical protein
MKSLEHVRTRVDTLEQETESMRQQTHAREAQTHARKAQTSKVEGRLWRYGRAVLLPVAVLFGALGMAFSAGTSLGQKAALSWTITWIAPALGRVSRCGIMPSWICRGTS